MSRVVLIAGSPSGSSRSEAVLWHVESRLRGSGHETELVLLRELPAEPVLKADVSDPQVAESARALETAAGVVISAPVYKGSVPGLLKAWLDLLPQFGLRDKTVLPLTTGGSLTSVLAIDYAFRPIFCNMGADHVLGGYFLLDSWVERGDRTVQIEAKAELALNGVIDSFAGHLPNDAC